MTARATPVLISACPIKPQETTINVRLQTPEPVIDHSHTRDELRDFSVPTVSPYGDDNSTHVNGLMRGPVELKTNMTLAWQSDMQKRENCFWYRTIDLTLVLNPTIYVAKDIPDGTCYYNAIIAHEMKHVETDRALIRDYRNILYDRVEDHIEKNGTIDHSPLGDEENAQKRLMKDMEAIVRDVHGRMRADRIERQARIDTLKEYNRVSAECDEPHIF